MKNNKKGFTLIEFMIVVAIIGILAAIAIPKFVQLKERYNINKEYQRKVAERPYAKSILTEEWKAKLRANENKFTDEHINDTPPIYSIYVLSNGSRISCLQATAANCGVNLIECKDGVNYLCQTNVTSIGGE